MVAVLVPSSCVAFAQTKTPAAQISRQAKKPQPPRAKGEEPAAVPASEDDWPIGGYDTGNTYYNRAEKTLAPPLVKNWEAKLGDLRPERVALSSGVVLAAGWGTKTLGSKNHVVALDARNGHRLWAFTLPGSQGSMEMTPTCSDGLAVLGGQKDDKLYAVDLRTGRPRWQHGEMANMSYCTVLVADGRVYANSGNGLWALDLQTGQDKWREKRTKAGNREAAIKSGKVFQPRAGALDAATGAPLWNNDLIANANQVAATDELVFVAAKDRLAALAMDDGTSVWETVPKADARYDQFLLVGDALYAGTRGDETTVYRLDVRNGTIRAERSIKQGLAKWVAANDLIYACTYDKNRSKGTLVALAADTLQDKWSMPVPAAIWSMAAGNGRLYVVGVKNNDNWICAFGNK